MRDAPKCRGTTNRAREVPHGNPSPNAAFHRRVYRIRLIMEKGALGINLGKATLASGLKPHAVMTRLDAAGKINCQAPPIHGAAHMRQDGAARPQMRHPGRDGLQAGMDRMRSRPEAADHPRIEASQGIEG